MAEPVASPQSCRSCGIELSPAMLACPGCAALVHAERLKELAAQAERARTEGDKTGALTHWRAALELLPPGSRQHEGIATRIAGLSKEVEAAPSPAPGKADSALKKQLLALGALGLLIWKLKFVAVFLLTKGKLLLLGLTKASTVFSMLLSFGVYWSVWGWGFAAGLIAAIYVHEMGHVAALRRYGISASAPMFLPGFGALVRMKQVPIGVREDARVGLAGPLWGLGATAAAWALASATGLQSLMAIAHTSAWINLFNLLPIAFLDGGRGFRALSRSQRGWAAAAIGAAWFLTGESLFVLLLLAAGFRFLFSPAPAEKDSGALMLYVALVGALALLVWAAKPVLATGL